MNAKYILVSVIYNKQLIGVRAAENDEELDEWLKYMCTEDEMNSIKKKLKTGFARIMLSKLHNDKQQLTVYTLEELERNTKDHYQNIVLINKRDKK